MLAAAASGLLVFASEVVFVHLLALVDGTSVYVFGLVLAVFLVALSARRGRVARPRAQGGRRGARREPGALGPRARGEPARSGTGSRTSSSPLGPYVARGASARSCAASSRRSRSACPPACMGTTFPLVLARPAPPRDDRGAQTGRRRPSTRWRRWSARSRAGFVAAAGARLAARARGAIALAYARAALLVRRRRGRRGSRSRAARRRRGRARRWPWCRRAGTSRASRAATNVYFDAQPEQGRWSGWTRTSTAASSRSPRRGVTRSGPTASTRATRAGR